jgi:hypothetical protein
MGTIEDGVKLPHCETLEELKRLGEWGVSRVTHYTRLNSLPPPSEVATMQRTRDRIHAHMSCPLCSSAGSRNFPRVRAGYFIEVPLGRK